MEQHQRNSSNELSEMVGHMSDAQFAQTLDVLLDMESPLADNSVTGGSSTTMGASATHEGGRGVSNDQNMNNLQSSAAGVTAMGATTSNSACTSASTVNQQLPTAGMATLGVVNHLQVLPTAFLSQQAAIAATGGGAGPIQKPLIAAAAPTTQPTQTQQQQQTQQPQIPSVFPPSFLMPILPSVPFGTTLAASAGAAAAAPAGVASTSIVGATGVVQQQQPAVATATTAGRKRRASVSSTPAPYSSTIRHSMAVAPPVSEDEGERHRRRQDRNLREQMRSQQITDQIKHLRQVLVDANIKFKSDKYSTLVSVAAYIKQLQDRSALLDDEHSKLLQTIIKSSEIVNNQYLPAVADSSMEGPFAKDDLLLFADGDQKLSSSQAQPDHQDARSSPPLDESMVFVNGIDYKSIFKGCPFACSIASIDGRFVDCNKEFEEMSGFARHELLRSPSPPGNNNDNKSKASSRSTTSPPPPPVPSDILSAVPSATAATATTSTSTSSLSSGSDGSSSPVAAAPVAVPAGPPLGGRSMSLFNIVQRDDMSRVFASMSDMLKAGPEAAESNNLAAQEWTNSGDSRIENVQLCRNQDQPARLSINLVRTTEGCPRFFNCLLLPS